MHDAKLHDLPDARCKIDAKMLPRDAKMHDFARFCPMHDAKSMQNFASRCIVHKNAPTLVLSQGVKFSNKTYLLVENRLENQ